MRMIGRVLTGAALSVVMFSADVAAARDWGRYDDYYGRRYDRHRHRDGIDGGDILLGVGIIAGIAVLASAAARDKDRRERTDGWPPRSDDYPNRYPNDRLGSRSDDGRDEAVNLCSAQAEREGEKYSSRVRINQIEDVRREGDGRFAVTGLVDIDRGGYGSRERRDDSWRNADRTRFTCTADKGRIVAFRFGSSAELSHRY